MGKKGIDLKLGLGTAQFGMDYGVSNPSGKTSPSEVAQILEMASKNHIQDLDTAYAYGESEAVLGDVLQKFEPNSFRIMTKARSINKPKITAQDAESVIETFEISLNKLNKNSIRGLFVHSGEDLLVAGGNHLQEAIQMLKKNGKISMWGVSVYTVGELESILANFDIDVVQIPINIFDQRFSKGRFLSEIKRRGIEIQARSVFLQGLLLMKIEDIPAYFSPLRATIKKLRAFSDELGLSPCQTALSFVNALPEIDTVITGVNNSGQLQEIIADISKVKDLRFDFSSFSIDDESLINPSRWSLT